MTSDTPKPQQLPFDLGHRTAFSRADFWVSGSNRDAVAWLDKYPDWPAPLLVIHGPEACGKTHLLRVWQNDTQAQPFDAAAVENAPSCVIVDDIDRLAGDRAAEEALLHLYNLQKERGGHILAASTLPPRDWALVLPDLRSRVMAAPVVAVGSPDDQLMSVVLAKLFSDRQIFVPQDVVGFIVARAGRSFAALADIAARLDRRALTEKRAVTIPLAREVLKDIDGERA